MDDNNNNNECTVREQDRFMPIANVIRIMRKTLPPHAKISDDAKETIQECVSEYISFVTSEANDRCQKEQRKTITAEDVIWAMTKLGFDDFVDPLTLYLNRYREIEGDRGSGVTINNNNNRGADQSMKRTASGGGGGGMMGAPPHYDQQHQFYYVNGGATPGFAPFHPHPHPHHYHPAAGGFYFGDHGPANNGNGNSNGAGGSSQPH